MYINLLGEPFQLEEECSYKTQYYTIDGNTQNLQSLLGRGGPCAGVYKQLARASSKITEMY
jgi:hypothetical protein